MSTTINLNAYAKINLTLDVLKRLESGYHEIETVYHQIGLHDTIILKELEEKHVIIRTNADIPKESNLAYKSAMLLKKRFKVQKGVEITIKKQIPIASGLSGGSTDAASVLIGLNKLWNLQLKSDALIEMAQQIGMDVPFSLLGGTALGTGRGETLQKIKTELKIPLLIIIPGFWISTAEAYKSLKEEELGKSRRAGKMAEAIGKEDLKKVAGCIGNDFEPWATRKYPEIRKIKQNLLEAGALNAALSGSGPTVFGIFENSETAMKAHKLLKGKYPFVQVTRSR